MTNNINITSTGSVINQGSIIANNNINILAKNEIINKNFSNIIAFNNLSMTSTDSSITNFSEIKANNAINLTAAKDITNTATILTNDSDLLKSNNEGVASYITNSIENWLER